MTQIFCAVILWWHRHDHRLSLDGNHFRSMVMLRGELHQHMWIHIWLQHSVRRAMERNTMDPVVPIEDRVQGRRPRPPRRRLPLASLLTSVANRPHEDMEDMVEVD